MNKSLQIGAAAVLALATALPVFAQAGKKHDSNTLHKLGKAIQYPINKAGQNISVTAHQATNKNSVVKKKSNTTGRKVKRVVTPGGRVRKIRKHEKS